MEDRPIGANAIKTELKKDLEALKELTPQHGLVIKAVTVAMEKAIDREPTIDPFTHGYWDREKGIHECSVCGYWNRNFFDLDCNYCPSCGAKMDAKTE